MKKRVLIITLALFSVATSSKSQQLDVGSGFFYIPGEDGLNLAVEGKVSYQFNDNWRASFSGDIFFSKSGIPQDASVVVNFPLTVATNAKGNFLNLEANYTSQQLYCSPFVLYGIGGLHYLYSKVTVDDPSLSAPLVGLLNGVEEESEFFGATLGVGEDIEISSKIIPYAEIKYYIVDDASFAGLVAGIKFTITD